MGPGIFAQTNEQISIFSKRFLQILLWNRILHEKLHRMTFSKLTKLKICWFYLHNYCHPNILKNAVRAEVRGPAPSLKCAHDFQKCVSSWSLSLVECSGGAVAHLSVPSHRVKMTDLIRQDLITRPGGCGLRFKRLAKTLILSVSEEYKPG